MTARGLVLEINKLQAEEGRRRDRLPHNRTAQVTLFATPDRLDAVFLCFARLYFGGLRVLVPLVLLRLDYLRLVRPFGRQGGGRGESATQDKRQRQCAKLHVF